MNPFQQLLRNRASRTPCGTWVMSASPIVAEAIGNTGFDWAVLDMEHTPLDLMDLVHLLQAVGNTPMAPLVRVPWNDTVNVKRVLDAGAASLLFPFIQNAEEARCARLEQHHLGVHEQFDRVGPRPLPVEQAERVRTH